VSHRDWALTGLLLVFFAVGFAGHMMPGYRALMRGLTPLAILVTVCVVAVPIAGEKNAGVALWMIGAAFLGLAVEVVGAATGAVFGAYSYGSALGPRVLGVPVVIGLNWALVVLGSVSLSARFVPGPWASGVLAGVLTTAFDWILEPFAVAAGYWTWTTGTIPLRNFAAWFIIASLFSLVFTHLRLSLRSPLASVAILIQAAFFAGLRACGA
jgi:putative membrane protein